MNHTLIESNDITKSVDAFLKKELAAIAIKNFNATKGRIGKISNLSRITSFEKLESLFDFNGIAYVLLRSRIIKEAEKLAMQGEFDPKDCLSQSVLLAIAADCGAMQYLGQADKKQMNKNYLHANWQIVAVMAWFAEHPGDELERYKLKAGKQYEIARQFIIDKLYSRDRTFFEFFNGTSYAKLCEKYDLGYGIEKETSEYNPEIISFTVSVPDFQDDVTFASSNPNPEIFEWLEKLLSIATRTESKIDSLSDNQVKLEEQINDFTNQFQQYIKTTDRPIKLDDISCRKIANFLSKMVDITSGKESKNLSTDSIIATINKGFKELKESISELAPDIIEELLDSAKTKYKYGVLVRIIEIFNDGDGNEYLEVIKNADLKEKKEPDLSENAPIYIIKYGKMDTVFNRIFSTTKYNEKNQYSTYLRVRPYLKRYADKDNSIIEDIPKDVFNTDKSKYLSREE